jgi:SAM-dependent methyltransferase
MSVFEVYAQVYDLIYRDKDYELESQFVHRIIQTHAPGAEAILDLGCGTGRHAIGLAQMGYVVDGVDMSGSMLEIAKGRHGELPHNIRERINFIQGDIRSIRLGTRYDAVLSLFHVLSYQATQQDVTRALDTIGSHLTPRGVCLFDFWYGPAVLSLAPAVRLKRLEDQSFRVFRVTEPTLNPNENFVDVNYFFFVHEKASVTTREFQETHRMRYFFMPELLTLLENADLTPLQSGEWLTGNPPGAHTWSVYILAKPVVNARSSAVPVGS